jgi:putative transposase
MPLCHLYYHFVWATHDRLPLITPVLEASLYQFVDHKTTEIGGYLYAIGGIEDHLHLIATTPPSLALSEYVKLIKGSSSRYINANYPPPNAAFRWQREYGVFSVSKRNLEQAIAYVQHQKHHHATGTTFPTLEPDALPKPTRPQSVSTDFAR